MRIAIFGSRGFIGKEFIKKVPVGYELFVCNRPEVDITKPETYREKLKDIQPDVVVNLAAKIGTMLSSVSVQEMFETNTMGCLNLAYAARDAGAKSYIYTSSTVVHGENKKNEHHGRFSLFAPKHPYSASKAAAEYGLQQFANEQQNMSLITLRPPMVIGEGTNIPLPPIEFVRAVQAGNEIKIFGDGVHEREFVSVQDVVHGIWKAILFAQKVENGYHPFFLTGNRISMRHLAELVVEKCGGNILYIPKTVQTFSLTTDPSDSKRLLAWESYDDLDSILLDAVRYAAPSERQV